MSARPVSSPPNAFDAVEDAYRETVRRYVRGEDSVAQVQAARAALPDDCGPFPIIARRLAMGDFESAASIEAQRTYHLARAQAAMSAPNILSVIIGVATWALWTKQ